MSKNSKIKPERIDYLEKKLNIRERLIRALESVNTPFDLNTILEMLMTLANQLIDTDASSILLMDEEKGQLYFAAATGIKKNEIKKIYLKKGEGIAGWVAENGKPLHIPDVSKDKLFSKKVDQMTGFTTHSVLAVPLKIEDKVIGVTEVVNKKKNKKFSSEDIELLEILSTAGALAIQKARLYQDLNELFISAVRAIADAIEAKDHYTRGHCERMRRFSLIIAEGLNLSEKEKKDLELSALLHDLGKIGVPDTILLKNDKPTPEEWEILKKHPVIGEEILKEIKQLKNVLPGVRYHHERYDGKGYPDGIAGENIPLMARILAVADSYDAMTSDRPYRKGLATDIAEQELIRLKGQQFDPQCIDIFLQNYEKVKKFE